MVHQGPAKFNLGSALGGGGNLTGDWGDRKEFYVQKFYVPFLLPRNTRKNLFSGLFSSFDFFFV